MSGLDLILLMVYQARVAVFPIVLIRKTIVVPKPFMRFFYMVYHLVSIPLNWVCYYDLPGCPGPVTFARGHPLLCPVSCLCLPLYLWVSSSAVPSLLRVICLLRRLPFYFLFYGFELFFSSSYVLDQSMILTMPMRVAPLRH